MSYNIVVVTFALDITILNMVYYAKLVTHIFRWNEDGFNVQGHNGYYALSISGWPIFVEPE